jgi:hypothetical protein
MCICGILLISPFDLLMNYYIMHERPYYDVLPVYIIEHQIYLKLI